jgi:hypothetical protein
VTQKKNSELLVYEPCDTPVALTNFMHLSCPSYGIINALFNSAKTKPPFSDSPVIHHCLMVLKLILMRLTSDRHGSQRVKYPADK